MSDVPAVLFSDDVLLPAMSLDGLEAFMDISTTRRKGRGMTRNTKRGKSRVPESEETTAHVLKLAHEELN